MDEPPNWARLPIHECGEPLVSLAEGGGESRVLSHALYAEDNIPGAPSVVCVRLSVRDRLVKAASLLPEGIGLMVFDGYRPLAVQQFLYDDFTARIARERPYLSDDALRAYVGQYVASPSADPACPPPHRTGGAVDIYLIHLHTGEPLPMGTAPDEVADATPTRWFEDYPQEPFTTNRRLLFHALIGAGFANYRGEWWHYEFGNQRWANCTGAEAAIYGIAPEAASDAEFEAFGTE